MVLREECTEVSPSAAVVEGDSVTRMPLAVVNLSVRDQKEFELLWEVFPELEEEVVVEAAVERLKRDWW